MHTKLITYRWGFIPRLNGWKLLCLLVSILLITACTDFVEVDLPKNQLSSEVVFNNSGTAEAALKGIYIEMRGSGLLSGVGGLNALMGLYTDELDSYSNIENIEDFQNHTLLATSPTITGWWNSAYNQIYGANAVIEGVENSVSLSVEDQNQFKGEALFIRGYLHLLLVSLFGDIPYIMTKDYIENTNVSRMPRALVYDHIITDLTLAKSLLYEADLLYDVDDVDIKVDHERTRPYAAVAEAILARAYLYTEDWAMAEAAADRVISEFGSLESDLNKVFLNDASGTIWQFKPNAGGDNTNEGSFFIITEGVSVTIAMTDDLFFAFESGTIFQPLLDQRRALWVEAFSNSLGSWHHVFKYKERNNTGTSREYSIQLRLAEQYLIRAEARAYLDNIPGAQADINAIRNRADLGNTTAATLDDLLDVILQERRVELFTEQGHRWFDLKRTGKAAEVLAPLKPNWKATDILLPIPEDELLRNSNLLPQNDGY